VYPKTITPKPTNHFDKHLYKKEYKPFRA